MQLNHAADAPTGISSKDEQIAQDLYAELDQRLRELNLDARSRIVIQSRLSHMLTESVVSRISRM